jgi:hypothetical protein
MGVPVQMGAKISVLALVFALVVPASGARAVAPLYDPVTLNIGINCQWQQHCERQQLKAMQRARRYIAGARPPVWKIRLCNTNARRGLARLDWIGFNSCIRNARLFVPASRRR